MNMAHYIETVDELNRLGYEVKSNYENGKFVLTISENILEVNNIEGITELDNILDNQLRKLTRIKKLKRIL